MSDQEQDGAAPRPTYHQEVQHSPATARVPEKVGVGVFSTGTIVMHGPHDFVIDFLQSLAHPRRVAARVVLPPTVIPLFLAAMQDNFHKYTQTFGPMPRMPVPHPPAPHPGGSHPQPAEGEPSPAEQRKPETGESPRPADPGGESRPETPFPLEHPAPSSAPGFMGGEPAHGAPPPPQPPPISEVYEQLKLPDDMLAGSYANTVVISHSGAEFCFDFITSFYPRSAVAARVYMATPHVTELFESLTRSWDQFRNRGR